MELKGFKKFREKIPAFSGIRILILPAYFLFVLALSLMIQIIFDSIPASSYLDPLILSMMPLAGGLLIGTVGFFLVSRMWSERDRLRKRYGHLSYQHIFLIGFTGVLCIISIAIGIFIPFWSYAPSFWAGSSLASPLAGDSGVEFVLRMALASIFSLLGFIMIVRSLLTFGIDYMTVVYLYFPEESKIQERRIYSILRHPTYAGLLYLAFGGMIFTFTPVSIALFLFLLGGFYIHVHFVEEKELIGRFGKSYERYMADTPAFIPSPMKAGELLRFLIGK